MSYATASRPRPLMTPRNRPRRKPRRKPRRPNAMPTHGRRPTWPVSCPSRNPPRVRSRRIARARSTSRCAAPMPQRTTTMSRLCRRRDSPSTTSRAPPCSTRRTPPATRSISDTIPRATPSWPFSSSPRTTLRLPARPGTAPRKTTMIRVPATLPPDPAPTPISRPRWTATSR